LAPETTTRGVSLRIFPDLSVCLVGPALRGIEPVTILSAFVLGIDPVSGNMRSGNQLSEAFATGAATAIAKTRAVAA
jgi:hypothetical protein